MLEILPLFCLILGVSCQINPPIPVGRSTPGIVLGSGSDSAQIKLEAFIELNCPDSEAAYPVLVNVSNHYQPNQVQVKLHLFTLHYHRNAGLCHQGFFKIQEALPDQKWNYLERIFDVLGDYSNTATLFMSESEVIDMLASDATLSTGIDATEFTVDLPAHFGTTITEWKYGSRRGVAGTPWFFVNGVDLGVPPTSENRLTFDQWKAYLDQLLGI